MYERIAERIEGWERGEKPGPYSIQLNPTNRCNLECRFCWQRTDEKIDYTEISYDRYMDLVEEAAALDVQEIEITGGGEPLMRKDLVVDLIKKIKKHGMKGKMITNGTDLDRDSLQEIVESEWDEIVFSIDGPEEVHDYLRQVEGCFQDTIDSMEKLKELKSGKLPITTLHMVLCNRNFDLVKETVGIADSTGCDNFFVEPIVTLAFDTDIGERLKMNKEETEEALENIKEAKELAERKSINHNLDSLESELIESTNDMDEVIREEGEEEKSGILGSVCYEPWYNMVIRPEGDVGPCCMFDNKGPKIMENSLEGIWFGEYFEEIRNGLKNNELLSFCSKCNPSQVSRNREIRSRLG